MHVRVRLCGKSEVIVVVPSKLTKIEAFRKILEEKFNIEQNLQRLFYGGKLLDNGYSFHDYNIKLNDVIQLMPRAAPLPESDEKKPEDSEKKETVKETSVQYEDAKSKLYRIGDLVDVRERVHNAWFEGKIVQIVKDPQYVSPVITPNETNYDIKVTNGNSNTENDSPTKAAKVTPSKSKSNRTSPSANKKVQTPQSSKGKKSNPDGGEGSSPKTTPQRGIKDYFSKKKPDESNGDTEDLTPAKNGTPVKSSPVKSEITAEQDGEDCGLLYKVYFDEEDDSSAQYCNFSEIRPRARIVIELEDLQINQTVLVNHNAEEPSEKGFWFDFTIKEINKLRKNTELVGTLYHGRDIPLHDVKVKCHDKIFVIETVVPISKRTEDYNKLITTAPEKRATPLACTKCRDNPEVSCKECGCNICAGKNQPETIILCDECNMGFHMQCLEPPMEELPREDWYCTDCRTDTAAVVAPGAAQQARKPNQSKSTRDWGRGMACVGKTQTCSMPANHFGPIPGTEVGMAWRFRIQLSESGIHRPPVSGIHGRDVEGAYSIVLSGGYEDDVDNGFEFTYTGSGGRDLSGNKRTADQSSDQTLTRENKALARNCAVKEVKEDGGDAGSRWRDGRPVRVVRSYKMLKHFPEYAPKEGIRYDGIYKVVKYYPETGKSGFRVWKYLLRRDDPNPAPWEENSKDFPIVYPDGYLEAEAEKQAQKEKNKLNGNTKKTPTRKRVLKEHNGVKEDSAFKPSDVDDKKKRRRSSKNAPDSPPPKKMRTRSSIAEVKEEKKEKASSKTPKRKKQDKSIDTIKSPSSPAVNPFTLAASKKQKMAINDNESQNENKKPEVLTKEEKEAIEKDTLNQKLWEECLQIIDKQGKQGLISKVTTLFLCIICQEVAANPVTTNCSHNFCMTCLKLAFKSTESQSCPHCRSDLSKEELSHNGSLRDALRTLLPGYDVRKK